MKTEQITKSMINKKLSLALIRNIEYLKNENRKIPWSNIVELNNGAIDTIRIIDGATEVMIINAFGVLLRIRNIEEAIRFIENSSPYINLPEGMLAKYKLQYQRFGELSQKIIEATKENLSATPDSLSTKCINIFPGSQFGYWLAYRADRSRIDMIRKAFLISKRANQLALYVDSISHSETNFEAIAKISTITSNKNVLINSLYAFARRMSNNDASKLQVARIVERLNANLNNLSENQRALFEMIAGKNIIDELEIRRLDEFYLKYYPELFIETAPEYVYEANEAELTVSTSP